MTGPVSRDPLILYGAAASGSVAVEAALTLLDIPFTVIEGATWASESAREQVASQNLMRQIPTLVLPDGETFTESAAILLYLADKHPAACLAPGLEEPARRQFLRWMFFVSSAIYALHWIKPDVRRVGAPAAPKTTWSTLCMNGLRFAGGPWMHRSAPGRICWVNSSASSTSTSPSSRASGPGASGSTPTRRA